MVKIHYLSKVCHVLHGNFLLLLNGELHGFLKIVNEGLEGRGSYSELDGDICPEHTLNREYLNKINQWDKICIILSSIIQCSN